MRSGQRNGSRPKRSIRGGKKNSGTTKTNAERSRNQISKKENRLRLQGKEELPKEGKRQNKRTRDSTNLVHVLHNVLPTGLKIRDEWNTVRNRLEIVDCEVDADGMRDGNEMEHGVCGTSEYHCQHLEAQSRGWLNEDGGTIQNCVWGTDHCILKGGPGHDVPRKNVFLYKVPQCRSH